MNAINHIANMIATSNNIAIQFAKPNVGKNAVFPVVQSEQEVHDLMKLAFADNVTDYQNALLEMNEILSWVLMQWENRSLLLSHAHNLVSKSAVNEIKKTFVSGLYESEQGLEARIMRTSKKANDFVVLLGVVNNGVFVHLAIIDTLMNKLSVHLNHTLLNIKECAVLGAALGVASNGNPDIFSTNNVVVLKTTGFAYNRLYEFNVDKHCESMYKEAKLEQIGVGSVIEKVRYVLKEADTRDVLKFLMTLKPDTNFGHNAKIVTNAVRKNKEVSDIVDKLCQTGVFKLNTKDIKIGNIKDNQSFQVKCEMTIDVKQVMAMLNLNTDDVLPTQSCVKTSMTFNFVEKQCSSTVKWRMESKNHFHTYEPRKWNNSVQYLFYFLEKFGKNVSNHVYDMIFNHFLRQSMAIATQEHNLKVGSVLSTAHKLYDETRESAKINRISDLLRGSTYNYYSDWWLKINNDVIEANKVFGKSIDNFKPLKEWTVGKDVNIYCEKGKLMFDMLEGNPQYHMVVDAMKTQRKK